MPEAFNELVAITQLLEKHYRDMQDIEFTIEHGKLWMLQTRTGKRTANAALRIAVEMAQRRPDHAGRGGHARRPAALDQLLHPTHRSEAPSAR